MANKPRCKERSLKQLLLSLRRSNPDDTLPQTSGFQIHGTINYCCLNCSVMVLCLAAPGDSYNMTFQYSHSSAHPQSEGLHKACSSQEENPEAILEFCPAHSPKSTARFSSALSTMQMFRVALEALEMPHGAVPCDPDHHSVCCPIIPATFLGFF